MLAGHANRDMFGPGKFMVGGIEAAPTRPWNIDLRPGMRGTVLALAHLDIPGDKSGPKTQVPDGLHHEDREIAARPRPQNNRLTGKLDTGFLSSDVFEGFEDLCVQLVQQVEGVDELTGGIEFGQPLLQAWTLIRIAGQTIGDEFDLLVGGVLERIGAGRRLRLRNRSACPHKGPHPPR